MRFLIDSNIVIPLEPVTDRDVEAGSGPAARFVALAIEHNHVVLIHPDARHDRDRDADHQRRQTRELHVAKYPVLDRPPETTPAMEVVIGRSVPGSNDWVDDRQLAAVAQDAVDYLVTEDGGIHRKATRLGLTDRVLHLDDAVALIESLSDQNPTQLPFVEYEPLHAIDGRDPIFSSLRRDYAGFDDWLSRAKRQGRMAFVIRAPGGGCAGLCIIKPDDDEYHLGGRVLKLCTFKVADEHAGYRYGELLLKGVFDFIDRNRYEAAWVTVFAHHPALLTLFEQFGFQVIDGSTALGEHIVVKRFGPIEGDPPLSALEHHIRFGPPALRLDGTQLLLVPIQPRYHRLLFPELERQLQFMVEPRPFGNAIRKAYLCNAPMRNLHPGDTLLFYRSHDEQCVRTIGVVEDVVVSNDPNDVARFVGARTVYTLEEIRHLAKRDVLAILFRQAVTLARPITIDELTDNQAVRRAPQTINRVRPEGTLWLTTRISG